MPSFLSRPIPVADATVIAGFDDGAQIVVDGLGQSGLVEGTKCWFWQVHGNTLRVFDLAQRRIALSHSIGPSVHGWDRMLVSSDDRSLFLLQGLAPDGMGRATQSRLWKFDLDQGLLVGQRGDLPAFTRAMRMDDGKLLFEGWGAGDPNFSRLVRIDPQTLDGEPSALDFARTAPSSHGVTLRWTTHSPDGRYWVRFDHSRIEVREDRPAGVPGPAPYFGVSLQIWTAFPFAFLHSAPVAFHSIDDLPDVGTLILNRKSAIHGRHDFKFDAGTIERALADTRPQREAIWRAVAHGMNRADGAPDAPFPHRSQFNRQVQTDDAFWTLVLRAIKEVQRLWSYHGTWQPDGEAVWLKHYRPPDRNAFVCVAMDGQSSPMLWSDADAGEPWEVSPKGRRQAIGTMRHGALHLDGRPRADIAAVVVPLLPKPSGPAASAFHEDSYYQRKMRQLRRSAEYRDRGFGIVIKGR